MGEVSYRKCQNPACNRRVLGGASWCCGGCDLRFPNSRFDTPGVHRPSCDERAALRGPFQPGRDFGS